MLPLPKASKNPLFYLILFLVVQVTLILPAYALTGDWQQQNQAAARLIASNQVDDNGTLYAGLQLTLKPGWDSYWRSPGDAGLPPMPEWKGSKNLKQATMLFPLPERFTLQGFETYGYKDEVVFPLRIEKSKAKAATSLNMAITLLTCSTVCVPAQFHLSLAIPAHLPAASAGDAATALLKKALNTVPKNDDGQGLSLQKADLITLAGRPGVLLHYTTPQVIADAAMIIEPGDGTVLPFTSMRLIPNGLQAMLAASVVAADIANKEFTFTFIDKTHHQAVEKKLVLTPAVTEAFLEKPVEKGVSARPASAAPPVPVSPAPAASFFVILGFAFLGGLILNLMPCVLPVLAIKSLSLVKHGGGDKTAVRLSFLYTSAGILFSFLLLAAAIIGLKQLGMSVGWGVQFQNPAFLLFLIGVLVLFGLNLWGLFEITLPRFIADKVGGGSPGKIPPHLADFCSGAFATLLATPCSAPFLGTAVGFALASGTAEILAVFAALGLGLATPFLLIAAFPKTATWLPKPGPWMLAFKRGLAVLLFITAAWLGLVLAHLYTAPAPQGMAESHGWQVFDEAKIAPALAKGQVVLVDVTADWCLTCQVNKKLVLNTPAMAAFYAQYKVLRLKADWTQHSETIAAYLRRFMRYGIPFDVVYGPGAPQGIALPELLSQAVVEQALKQAAEKMEEKTEKQ